MRSNLNKIILVSLVSSVVLWLSTYCTQDQPKYEERGELYPSPDYGPVVKTEFHEYSSVPKTVKKVEFNSPEIEFFNTYERDDRNVLTFDFRDKHNSHLHDYHHYSDSYGHYPHHTYEYHYHYRPTKRPLTRYEIEKNRKDRIDVFKAFARSFFNIGGNRNNKK